MASAKWRPIVWYSDSFLFLRGVAFGCHVCEKVRSIPRDLQGDSAVAGGCDTLVMQKEACCIVGGMDSHEGACEEIQVQVLSLKWL